MDNLYSIINFKNVQVLRVNSLLNELGNREIIKAVDSRIASGFCNFVVDLSAVENMNSVGINFLIHMKHRAKETGGRLAVINASPRVKQLLDITKLRPMFMLADSMDDAVAFMSA